MHSDVQQLHRIVQRLDTLINGSDDPEKPSMRTLVLNNQRDINRLKQKQDELKKLGWRIIGYAVGGGGAGAAVVSAVFKALSGDGP